MNEFDVVIGGSGEIGLGIIAKLLSEGRNVVYTYNSNSDVVRETDKMYSRIISVKSDVQSSSDIENLANLIEAKRIKISSVIYAAGKTNDKLFISMSEEDFADVMDVNLYGCFRVCKALINNLAVNQGCIVLISSVSGMTGKIGQVNYSCSKAGMIAMCRNLALEYAAMGIRVNCIAPGLIKTKMLDKVPERQLNAIKKNIPLKRLGLPSDVANAVFFLVSGSGGYITGQTLVVDGGLLMR